MATSSISGFSITLFITVPFFCLFFACSQEQPRQNISPDKNYPRWLKNDSYRTEQTSGITFLRRSKDGSEEFLLADDVGNIHRFFIKDDTVFNFMKIDFSIDVVNYLKDFPKPDFEEIVYDKYTSDVYITIEGNKENHIDFHGVYKLEFEGDDVFQNSVTKIEKIKFTPEKTFYKNLNKNTGYEGLAVDKNYFYIGLEAVLTPEKSFSGSTNILVANKKSLDIVKEISTESLGITTVCGLYCDENFSLWGIDRNQKKVFKLKLDEYFNIVELNFFEIRTVIPDFHQYEYAGSLESITFSPGKKLYIVDDPWKEQFNPPVEILRKLDKNTVENFRNVVPMIYKYSLE
ncbi:MAG: hypothetical protein ACHQLA_06030 [Ignavibacteriales bacterium]